MLKCKSLFFLGAGGVGGLDPGEELHPGSSGLREGPEQRAEVTSETQDPGWRTAGPPLAAAGVDAFDEFLCWKKLQYLEFQFSFIHLQTTFELTYI